MSQSASETCEDCVLCAQRLYELVVLLFHRGQSLAKLYVALGDTRFRRAL